MIRGGESLFQNPDQRREIILETAQSSGFSPELVEKDWILSLILEHLVERKWPLIFKGGTCLVKCYLDFYRLSEDLDFVHINSNRGLSHGARRSDLKKLEQMSAELVEQLGFLTPVSSNKFDSHQQMAFQYAYASPLSEKQGTVKLEITHRDSLLLKPESRNVRTLAMHPILRELVMESFTIACMQIEEMVAEKIRACVTRKMPAIRDYYDLTVLKKKLPEIFLSSRLHDFVRRKLKFQTWRPVPDIWIPMLRKQIAKELNPTLGHIESFDLNTSIELVRKFLPDFAAKD